MKRLKLLSGVFSIRPKNVLTIGVKGGMVRLTPKKEYLAFKTDYEISNQPGKSTIMIVHEKYRYFPVTISYASGNFDYIEENSIENQIEFLNYFNKYNEHIRAYEEKIELWVEKR